jgi:hypothetical protein
LRNTTELLEEFTHVILKVTAYILKAELTPRMFKERVEKAYLDNFTLGPVGEPDPMDVLEEEYMDFLDDDETQAEDSFNPWGEEDARELEAVTASIEPYEALSPVKTTPDSAVAPAENASMADGIFDDDDEF